MTAASTSELPALFEGLDIGTLSCDALRARVQVRGTLDEAGSSLLLSIVRSHVTAGRRYLRIDLGDARIESPAIVRTLGETAHTIEALGGMLVLENVDQRLAGAGADSSLFVAGAI